MRSAAECLAEAERRLERAGVPSARLEAEVLLAEAKGVGRADLLAHLPESLPKAIETRFEASLRRREGREPLFYITGHREFWSLDLRVTPSVLIPRPETETLVEETLRRLPPKGKGGPPGGSLKVLDLGTGSGNVALALTTERPDLWVVATDVSVAALAIAAENARRLGLGDRVQFVAADWLSPFRKAPIFDAIVSNPPYILEREWGDLPPEVASYEPRVALLAGPNGKLPHGAIALASAGILKTGGWLLLEIGSDQGQGLQEILGCLRDYDRIERVRDLAGRDRVLAARRH